MCDIWEKMLNGKYDSGTTVTEQIMNVLTTYAEDNLLYKYTQCQTQGQKQRHTSGRIKIGIKKPRHRETDTQNISKWAKTQNQDTPGYPEIETHKKTTKATDERMGTVNQGHIDSGSKIKRHGSRHQTQTDTETQTW